MDFNLVVLRCIVLVTWCSFEPDVFYYLILDNTFIFCYFYSLLTQFIGSYESRPSYHIAHQ